MPSDRDRAEPLEAPLFETPDPSSGAPPYCATPDLDGAPQRPDVINDDNQDDCDPQILHVELAYDN